MKKLIVMASVLAMSASLIAETKSSSGISTTPIPTFSQTKPVDGTTTISNNSAQKLKVEWQTYLSESIKSPVYSQLVNAKTKNFQSSEGVEWFQEHSADSTNDLVYVLEVKVYDVGGSMLSEEKLKITRSHSSMVGAKAKNDLHIMIASNYAIGYSLN